MRNVWRKWLIRAKKIYRVYSVDQKSQNIGGLSEKEAAEILDISVATLKRDWTFAKTWLYGRLR